MNRRRYRCSACGIADTEHRFDPCCGGSWVARRATVRDLLAEPITLTRERLYVLVGSWAITAMLVTASITR